MPKLGRYAKAYPAHRFSEFPRWVARSAPARVVAEKAGELDEESSAYYFLQEDYTVTAGIFMDEDIAFDAVTDEWREFCRDILRFEAPAPLETSAGNSTGNGLPDKAAAAAN